MSKYHPVYTWWKWAVMPSFLSFFAILLLYKFPFTRNVFIWYLTFQQTYTEQIYFNKHSLYSQICFMFLSLDIQRNKAVFEAHDHSFSLTFLHLAMITYSI